MRYPTVFVNHGGGPLPLLGRQPELASHLKELVAKWLPAEPPQSIVVLSAHWESDPVQISSGSDPDMYFDYYGFPPESYKYNYAAPGSPALAEKIQTLLAEKNIPSELDPKRGFDHGVFVPLMLMYPEAKIPVVAISLHDSLSPAKNMAIGRALESLPDEGVLIVGSGLSFHNMQAFFNPSKQIYQASRQFDKFLRDAILKSESYDQMLEKLQNWADAPGGRMSHPREEHLLPLLMVAAAAGPKAKAQLVFESGFEMESSKFAMSGYMFQ